MAEIYTKIKISLRSLGSKQKKLENTKILFLFCLVVTSLIVIFIGFLPTFTNAHSCYERDENGNWIANRSDCVLWGWQNFVDSVIMPTGINGVYKAFTEDSFWNIPIPPDAPIHPDSAKIIAFLSADNTHEFVRLSGLGKGGTWGRPIYWGYKSGPTYQVDCARKTYDIHIPDHAKADPSSDAALTVYDMVSGHVFGLHGDPGHSMWCSSAHVLRSNGLDNKWTQFPDTHPDNTGHRGAPASNIGIRYDEILAGKITHKLHLSVNNSKNTHVFPLVGDENGTSDPYAPPEGALIRIKQSVDLSKRNLSPPAMIIARALQIYGAYVGEQSGGPINIKVENTIAEGKGDLWAGVLAWDALKDIPIQDYEVIEYGYGCGSYSACVPAEQE